MKTAKPISTIHYCDKDILKSKLDDFVQRDILTFYAFIYHHAEEDEKKDHLHIYLEPSNYVDTNQLRDELEVPNPLDLTKPFRSLPIGKSKFSTWYLYSKHDTRYLASIGQIRKYHYNDDDFITSNDDYFHELIHLIDLSKLNSNYLIVEAVERGENFVDLVKRGQVPIQQVSAYKYVFDLMQSNLNTTFRNGKQGHEMPLNHSIDNKTGEKRVLKTDKDIIDSIDDERLQNKIITQKLETQAQHSDEIYQELIETQKQLEAVKNALRNQLGFNTDDNQVDDDLPF